MPMHLEFLVEDSSGQQFLEHILPGFLGEEHTFRVIPYKGIGSIPANLHKAPNPATKSLLNNLPKLLNGYGKAYPKGGSYPFAVVVVCDLDDQDEATFRAELDAVLASCSVPPEARFCLSIEEMEAWLLGDRAAVLTAYPKAKLAALNAYVQDRICGTWEHLADAVFPGGAKELSKRPYFEIGTAKHEWADKIPPHMDLARNASPSFNAFVATLNELVA
jgi:hypothetical protein